MGLARNSPPSFPCCLWILHHNGAVEAHAGRVGSEARECVSTRIWWVVGGLNSGLNFSIIAFEPHPLGKSQNPAAGRRRPA